jgi:tRNA pseudouridine55 synthase
MSSVPLSGVLVVDKPAGPTSHDVVDRVRAILGLRRVGHTGTLDPFATGVLPVCVGKATRLASHLARDDKRYRATVRFGFATTTDDLHGEPLAAPQTARLTAAEVDAACRSLTGGQLQVPPAFSAKRVAGQRLYALARQGVAVERRAAPVTVHAIELLSLDGELAVIEVCCSSGTYVRALARDLGQALAVGGHLVALRRLACGPFTCEQALAWERLEAEARERLLPLSALLSDWPAVRVGPPAVELLRHGRDLALSHVAGPVPAAAADRSVRILDAAGELLALASWRRQPAGSAAPPVEPVLHPDVVLI